MIGIAFQGCACRAAFHAGVAAALVEGGVHIELSSGASSGSLSAAALAAGLGARIPSVWRSLAGRSVISLRRALLNRSIFDMSHLVKSALREHLGAADFRAHPIEALVVATHLKTMSRRIFSSRSEADLVPPLLASCYLPVLYGLPVRLCGQLYVDGGATDNLPIEILAERGADEVIAVVASTSEHILKDLRRRRWRPAFHALASTRLHVVRPRTPLLLGSWDFDRDRMERAIDEGYARGRELAGR